MYHVSTVNYKWYEQRHRHHSWEFKRMTIIYYRLFSICSNFQKNVNILLSWLVDYSIRVFDQALTNVINHMFWNIPRHLSKFHHHLSKFHHTFLILLFLLHTSVSEALTLNFKVFTDDNGDEHMCHIYTVICCFLWQHISMIAIIACAT